MSDIIETAYHEGKPRHWDALGRWLRTHARGVNGVEAMVEATRRATHDGLSFPDSPETARHVIRKYEYEARRH